ncbi:hypothetical protein [Reyranella sp.]|jgi:hypothetical protein|uniref:hypothetical protein n=1 Tax=Reyranella sp. TaxID=1929291 RepID=UPI002F9246C2
MTSRTDEKLGRKPGGPSQEGSHDNVVQLAPKLKARKAARARASDSPQAGQRANRPSDGGDDGDPGPSAA